MISEIAQFESQRLGFLFTLKNALLEMHDRLSSTQKPELEEPPSNLAPFLDMKRTLNWVQFILPAELTYSLLKSTTLHDTFGPFGEIAEIFLFAPQPEGFIIFHGHVEIPNIDVIVSPQYNLIQIKNSNYSSLPIRSAGAPHYPTRRPALGTPVTLPGMGYTEPYVVTVVVIEQNHWATEWTYMMRTEKKGRPPQLITAILEEAASIYRTPQFALFRRRFY